MYPFSKKRFLEKKEGNRGNNLKKIIKNWAD